MADREAMHHAAGGVNLAQTHRVGFIKLQECLAAENLRVLEIQHFFHCELELIDHFHCV